MARPPPGPSATVPSPPAPSIAVIEAGRYDQERDRIKLALARDQRNALVPADVGYYMDVLQGRLNQVAGKPVDIGRQGDRIVLRWSLQPGFEPGSAQIDFPFRKILTSLVEVLVQYRMTLVSVLVRPEKSGNEAVSAQLAHERSLAVARHLVDAGLVSSRIVVGGPGTNPAPARNQKATGVTHAELQLDPIVRDP